LVQAKKNMPRLQVPIIVSRFIISYNECEFKHMIVHKMSIFQNKNSTFWKKFYTFVLYIITHLLTACFSYLYIVGDYPRNVFHYFYSDKTAVWYTTQEVEANNNPCLVYFLNFSKSLNCLYNMLLMMYSNTTLVIDRY